LDHLGVDKFFFFGNCIGGSFGMKLAERAPKRLAGAIISQTIGHNPDDPDIMYNHGRDGWATEHLKTHPDVSMSMIEKYLHNLYRAQPDFVYSVSRDFARTCQTPILVLPDNVPVHPLSASVDIASLCPNAEITVYPWREPPELKARTIERARTFLKRHLPA
jgi:pimeloyl-ACP methyl ester carboxylesterase